MQAAPLVFAALLALCWLGGWAWLRWQRIAEEAALRRRLRKSHPRADLSKLSDLERMVQPFSPDGQALYAAEVAQIKARYSRSVTALSLLGLACLIALVLLARGSLA